MIRVIVLIILAVTNLLAFLLMSIDKRRARKKEWRIPERTLFLATACFGGLGGTLGMFLLRHKTKHWYFRVFFPLMLAIQIVILVFLFVKVL